MRMLAVLALALFLGSTRGDDDANKKDMKAIEGEFKMVSGTANVNDLPEEMVKTGKRVSKDGETTVELNGRVLMKAKFTVDASKKPKEIDYEATEGTTKGKKHLGIYEIDGDTIKFCFAAPDKPRPTEFGSKAGSGHTLSVWKREKKEK